MKRSILVVVLLVALPAAAQDVSGDRVGVYRQLLTRANDELAQAMAQANALAIENAKLKAENEKLKKPEAK